MSSTTNNEHNHEHHEGTATKQEVVLRVDHLVKKFEMDDGKVPVSYTHLRAHET